MPRDGASTRHPAGDAARALIDLLKVDPAKLSDDEVCVFCDLLDGDEREPACGPSVRPAPPPAPSIAIVKGPAVAVQAPQAMHLPAASPVRRSSAAKPRSPRRSRVVGFGIVGAVAGSALAAVASAVLFLGPGELTAAPHHAMPTYWAQSTAASGWIGPNNSGIGPAWAWREAMALRLASGGNDGATDVQGGALTTVAMRSSDERSICAASGSISIAVPVKRCATEAV